MKLRRIHLRNFKGVAENTVHLGDGVTVIAGPNEAGKSSLAQALDLLFGYKDRSKHRSVKAADPVHRDAGPEVEADVEAGPYRFTYRKRFMKKAETELTVTAPRAESLTGDEAHERVEAILAESVDVDLWKALRIEQGAELKLPDLAESRSLSAALDRAAGSAQTDDDAASLFERVRAERETYFTATGKEKKALTESAAAVTDAEARRDELTERLRRLEADVARSRDLVREEADARARLAKDETDAALRTEEMRVVERRVAEVERLEANAAAAGAQGEAATRERSAREVLVERAAAAAEAAKLAVEEATAGDPATERAATALAAATAALADARGQDTATAAVFAVRSDDLAFRRDELDYQTLDERRARIVAADEAAEEAEAKLADARIDAATLSALRAAERDVAAARVRAEAGSPRVEIVAETDVSVRTGDTDSSMDAGETRSLAALDEVVIEAPGVVKVSVRPAGDAAQLRAELLHAESALADALERVGASDVAAAEEALAQRQEAERIVARRDEVVKQDLRDLSRTAIDRKHGKLAQRVAAYVAERGAVAGAEDVPSDFDAAQETLASASSARDSAAIALDDARRAHETARDEVQRLQIAAEGCRARREVAEREAARVAVELTEARSTVIDAALSERVEERLAAAKGSAEQAAEARKELDATGPADVRRLLDAATAAVTSTRAQLRATQDEALRIRTRLKEAGQEGLAEQLDRVETALLHGRRLADGLRRRADSADRLYRTLAAHRDDARRAYVRPLKEKIVSLGKLVFGGAFDIELGDDLRIVNRTLDERTVPYDGLSGGAQEQLDLLTRLAAAMIVSDDDGVPLILDDALGYSDPARLQAIGAVLSLAGKHCQVIVLTCVPDRYRHVAGATVIQISADTPIED